jgi:hypothetical protein
MLLQGATDTLAFDAFIDHVLDLMHAFHDASRDGRHVELESSCERPAPLPADLAWGSIDG